MLLGTLQACTAGRSFSVDMEAKLGGNCVLHFGEKGPRAQGSKLRILCQADKQTASGVQHSHCPRRPDCATRVRESAARTDCHGRSCRHGSQPLVTSTCVSSADFASFSLLMRTETRRSELGTTLVSLLRPAGHREPIRYTWVTSPPQDHLLRAPDASCFRYVGGHDPGAAAMMPPFEGYALTPTLALTHGKTNSS